MKNVIQILLLSLLISSCKEKETTCAKNQELIDGTCQCIYTYCGNSCENETRELYYGYYHGEIHDITNDTTVYVDSLHLHSSSSIDMLNGDVKMMNAWSINYFLITLSDIEFGTITSNSLIEGSYEGYINFINNDSLFSNGTISFYNNDIEMFFKKY